MGDETLELTLEHEGKTYTWSEDTGFIDRNYMVPPKTVIRYLERKLEALLAERDEGEGDPQELIHSAAIARQQGMLHRAEGLARRALELRPSPAAACVLSACLRERGKPRDAIAATEPFARSQNPALLTTRAAAFVDIGDFGAAKKHLDRAYAIAKSMGAQTGEIGLVYGRIKSENG